MKINPRGKKNKKKQAVTGKTFKEATTLSTKNI
jgi:hypothetical protein